MKKVKWIQVSCARCVKGRVKCPKCTDTVSTSIAIEKCDQCGPDRTIECVICNGHGDEYEDGTRKKGSSRSRPRRAAVGSW